MLRAFTLLLAAPTFAAAPGGLQADLDHLAATFPGRLGVAVRDLDSGERAAIRGGVPAPMASVFKLPTALAVLRRSQEQQVPLTTPVQVHWEDRSPGWSPLANRVPREGLTLSLDALLSAMVSESDNTAADALLRWMGGPEEVTRTLKQLGVAGVAVHRSEHALAYDLWGVTPPAKAESLEDLLARLGQVPRQRRLEAMKRFSADPRDEASPQALVELLARLEAGSLLDPSHTARLQQLLRDTRTGLRSLRAGLPSTVQLAHKTGQIGSQGAFTVAVNDVGVASGGGRRVAVAVLVTDADAPVDRCEDVIAEVARRVWARLGPPAEQP
jgi:beta-lactamase class A